MIGAMLTALWHLGGWWQLGRLRRVGAREAPEEAQRLLAGLLRRFALRHAVKLVVSVEVAVPTLLGLAAAAGDPAGGRAGRVAAAAVGDDPGPRTGPSPPLRLPLNLVQTAIETLLFYHPAVWWVARQIRVEREMCCDEQAVAAVGDRLGYARALTALAELCRRPAAFAGGPGLGAAGGSFSTRIRRLLGLPGRDRVALPAWLGGGWPLLLLIAAVAGVMWAGDKAAASAGGRQVGRGGAGPRRGLLKAGQFDKAIADFTEAIRMHPKSARAYPGRAKSHGISGDLDAAISDCTEAIRLDPTMPGHTSSGPRPTIRRNATRRPSPTSRRPSGSI